MLNNYLSFMAGVNLALAFSLWSMGANYWLNLVLGVVVLAFVLTLALVGDGDAD